MENILKKCIIHTMRIRPFFYSLVGICAAYTVAHGATSGTKSFITAQSFPKTFDDLSFTDRLAVKTEGYETWDSEYDASGRCVKNCAYPGITIQEEEYLSYKAGQELRELIEEEEEQEEEPITPVNPHISTFFGPPVSANPVRVISDFGERDIPNGSKYHKGIDIEASTGTPVYATANGKVTVADNTDNSAEGKYIEIEHSFTNSNKKVHTLYLHLNDLAVSNGATVTKGQLIGYAGNTGRSNGAHLHYRINFDRIAVDPTGSLIRPVLDDDDKEEQAMQTKGHNFIGGPYCFRKAGLTSIRLQGITEENLILNFRGCVGWCN